MMIKRKSAIRWLRQHANEYNIDTNRIIASGNSAGGHLIVATALVDNWNEKTDDLSYSPVPNVLLVNSGVYDLNDDNTTWIRQGLRDRNQDENLVKEISPNYLIKKTSSRHNGKMKKKVIFLFPGVFMQVKFECH